MKLHPNLRLFLLSIISLISVCAQGVTPDVLLQVYETRINQYLAPLTKVEISDELDLVLGVYNIIYSNKGIDQEAVLSNTEELELIREIDTFLEMSYLGLRQKYYTPSPCLDVFDTEETGALLARQKSPTSITAIEDISRFQKKDCFRNFKRKIDFLNSHALLSNLSHLLFEELIKKSFSLRELDEFLNRSLRFEFSQIALGIINRQENSIPEYPFQLEKLFAMSQADNIEIIGILEEFKFLFDRQVRHLMDKILLFTGKRNLHYLLPYVIAEGFLLASTHLTNKEITTPAQDLAIIARFYFNSSILVFDESFKSYILNELDSNPKQSRKKVNTLEKALYHELLHTNYAHIF